MAVAYQNTDGTSGTTVSSLSFNLTISGSDLCLLAGLFHTGGSSTSAPTHDSVTYNSDAMVKEVQRFKSDNEQSGSVWRLANPDNGSAYSLAATLSGNAAEVILIGISYTGVHQTAPIGGMQRSDGSSDPSQITTISATNDMVVSFCGCNRTTLATNEADMTSRKEVENVATVASAGVAEKAGASTVTTGWSFGATGYADMWVEIAVSLRPTGATPRIYFNAATVTSTTAASGRTGDGALSVTLPVGWGVGQYAVMVVYNDQGDASTPTDWTEITGSPFGTDTPKLCVFTKFLASGEATPSTTISGSATNKSHCAVIATYSNVDTTTPLDVIGAGAQGTGATVTAGGVTTVADYAYALGLCGRGDNEAFGSQTFGGSSTGVTERVDGGTSQGDDCECCIYDKEIASHGATGDGVATTSNVDPYVTVIIALKPLQTVAASLSASIYDIVYASENITKNLNALFASIFDSPKVSENLSGYTNPILVSVSDQAAASESLSEFFDKLSKSITDLTQVSEFVSLFFPTAYVNISDTAAVSENVAAFLNALNISIDDDVNVSEALSLFIDALHKDIYDSATVAEAITLYLHALFVSIQDTAAVSEDVVAALEGAGIPLSTSIYDGVSVSEFLAAYLTAVYPSATDQIAVSELVQIVLTVLHSSLSDSASVSEYVNLYLSALHPEVSDTAAVSESITAAVSAIVITELNVTAEDNLTASDVVTLLLALAGVVIHDAVQVSESLTIYLNLLSKSIFDTIAVAESVSVSIPSHLKGPVIFMRRKRRWA